MNRLVILALAAAILAPVAAHADDGRWMDTRNRIMLFDDPQHGSAGIARLQYAKAICHQQEGTQVGDPITPKYMPCMKKAGFAWLAASPAEIAAREKAVKAAQWRGMLSDLGDALAQTAASQPRVCNGQAFMGGHFRITCN